MTTKELILAFFNAGADVEATSSDIYESIGTSFFRHGRSAQVSSDTVDRNLKELVDAGTLTREKKNAAAGNRKVYYYRLATRSDEPIKYGQSGLPPYDLVEEPEVSSLNVGADGNLQGETLAEESPSGPRIIFIVRKNDVSPYVWGRAQFKYAEVLRPFDRSGRTFMQFGNAIVSMMLSDAAKENIIGALENANLGITYTVAESVEDAIEAMHGYTPNLSSYTIENFRRFSVQYIARFTNEPVITATQSEPKSPMQKFADREFNQISNTELLEVLAVLAKDYLERNPDTH